MFRAERIPERIDRPNPSAGADSQRLPVIRYGICSAAYANFLCLRPAERKNLEGMYMKKVVAMMLSLVLALGLMAGCGQKDAGKASGGTKTIESLKIAFSPYADAD